MPYTNPHPPIRLSPLAKKHLEKIVCRMKEKGMNETETGFVSRLIMAQPIPDDQNPSHCDDQPDTRKNGTQP